MIKPIGFYVYLHRKASDGEVFYVGKGSGKRAWSPQRSVFWKRTKDKHGVVVEIYADNLSEESANAMERELIQKLGRKDWGEGPLVNLTDGGDGVSNPSRYIRSAQSNFLKRLHSDPDFVARRKLLFKQNMERYWNTPEGRAIASERLRKANERMRHDPGLRDRRIEWVKRAHSKRLICIETAMCFDSLGHAVEWLRENGHPKSQRSALSQCCTGKLKTAYGMTWKYVESKQ